MRSDIVQGALSGTYGYTVGGPDAGLTMTLDLIGGVQVAPTDVYVEATVLVTGAMTTTYSTKTWAGMLLPFNFLITTSVMRSDIVTAGLSGTFFYVVPIPEISMTISLDLIVNVEGTAHVVPDPALGGLTAMGLAGAGVWLRRRWSRPTEP
jgi:hypothetical protein